MNDEGTTSSGGEGTADNFPQSPRSPSRPKGIESAKLTQSSPLLAKLRRFAELFIAGGSTVSAVLPLLVLIAMLVVLFLEAIPAIRFNGFGFFTGSTWNVGNAYAAFQHSGGITHLAGAHYGALPLIVGTLLTSAIALIVGFPIAVGAAVLVVEKLPNRLASIIGLFLEVLAGVPSAVIGLWGILTFGPWLAAHVYPWLSHMPNVPVLNYFHGSFNHAGQGLLTAGLVLAAMIVPIIAATTRDLLRQVPEATKEAAEALGMTDAEVFRTVQARWVRTGVIGAAVLGLGRALGETIAMAIVAGGIQYVPSNIYQGVSTIAAAIVLQLDAALTDPTGLAVKTLAELALILMVITLSVNVIARVIVRRAAKGAVLPVGAGF
jgi:phosphate transport system permease protein